MRAVRGEGGEKGWLRCVNRRSHPGHRHSLLTLSSPPRLAQTSICFDPGFCPSTQYIGLRGDVRILPNTECLGEISKLHLIYRVKGRCQNSTQYIGLRGDVKIPPNIQG